MLTLRLSLPVDSCLLILSNFTVIHTVEIPSLILLNYWQKMVYTKSLHNETTVSIKNRTQTNLSFHKLTSQ